MRVKVLASPEDAQYIRGLIGDLASLGEDPRQHTVDGMADLDEERALFEADLAGILKNAEILVDPDAAE